MTWGAGPHWIAADARWNASTAATEIATLPQLQWLHGSSSTIRQSAAVLHRRSSPEVSTVSGPLGVPAALAGWSGSLTATQVPARQRGVIE